MNLNEKVITSKVIEIIEIYDFYFDHFPIRLCLKNLNFKFQKTRTLNIIWG